MQEPTEFKQFLTRMIPQACVRFNTIFRHQYNLQVYQREDWKVPFLKAIILDTINEELSYHANLD